jgi:hypothetical protein
MARTATVEYAIEYQQDGVWQRWYANADRTEAEREWAHVRAIRPQVPVRFMEVEVLRSTEAEG